MTLFVHGHRLALAFACACSTLHMTAALADACTGKALLSALQACGAYAARNAACHICSGRFFRIWGVA